MDESSYPQEAKWRHIDGSICDGPVPFDTSTEPYPPPEQAVQDVAPGVTDPADVNISLFEE